jgi:hypothetical protein
VSGFQVNGFRGTGYSYSSCIEACSITVFLQTQKAHSYRALASSATASRPPMPHSIVYCARPRPQYAFNLNIRINPFGMNPNSPGSVNITRGPKNPNTTLTDSGSLIVAHSAGHSCISGLQNLSMGRQQPTHRINRANGHRDTGFSNRPNAGICGPARGLGACPLLYVYR